MFCSTVFYKDTLECVCLKYRGLYSNDIDIEIMYAFTCDVEVCWRLVSIILQFYSAEVVSIVCECQVSNQEGKFALSRILVNEESQRGFRDQAAIWFSLCDILHLALKERLCFRLSEQPLNCDDPRVCVLLWMCEGAGQYHIFSYGAIHHRGCGHVPVLGQYA